MFWKSDKESKSYHENREVNNGVANDKTTGNYFDANMCPEYELMKNHPSPPIGIAQLCSLFVDFGEDLDPTN